MDWVVDIALVIIYVVLGWAIGTARESRRWWRSAYRVFRKSVLYDGKEFYVLTKTDYEAIVSTGTVGEEGIEND